MADKSIVGTDLGTVTFPVERGKVREFLLQWLKVDQYPNLVKDAKQFPGFDQSVAHQAIYRPAPPVRLGLRESLSFARR